MGICSSVIRRNGMYIFRKRVPSDLQELLGMKYIKQSLKTSDANEAKLRRLQLEASIMERFKAARAKLNGEIPQASNTPSAIDSAVPSLPLAPNQFSQVNARPSGMGLTLQDLFGRWATNKRRSGRNAGSIEVGVERYRQKLSVYVCISMVTIQSTIEFIRHAHQEQFDKAGAPYYLHPIAVMQRIPEKEDDTIKIAALLHDVLEDTHYTKMDLLNLGYSEASIEIVELLTNSKSKQDYAEKIRSIIASGNRGAILVKYADVSENSDPKRLALLPLETQERLKTKYAEPLALLRRALGL